MVAQLKNALILCGLLLLTGCASYGGHGLRPGESTIAEVVGVMGEPVMRWRDADGSEQLAYPRGPAGIHTFMAFFAPDGRLLRLENVLEERHFARIRPGEDDQAAILRLLGPSNPVWTTYYAARDELVWEWRFCNDWSRLARFDVLFDATSGRVRSAYQRPELRGRDGVEPFCSR